MNYKTIESKTVESTFSLIATTARAMIRGTAEKTIAKAIFRIQQSEDYEIDSISSHIRETFGINLREGRFQKSYEARNVFEAIMKGQVPCEEGKFDKVAINALTHLSSIINKVEFAEIRDEAITIFCEEDKPATALAKLKKSVKSPSPVKEDSDEKDVEASPSSDSPSTFDGIFLASDSPTLSKEVMTKLVEEVKSATKNQDDETLEGVEKRLTALLEFTLQARQSIKPNEANTLVA